IVVTGDLANIGLPDELARALVWLSALGSPERVAVVPGNHDIYGILRRDRGTARWIDYMSSDAEGTVLAGAAGFPFVRVLGMVARTGATPGRRTPRRVDGGGAGPDQPGRRAPPPAPAGPAGPSRLGPLPPPPLPGQSSRSRGLKDDVELERVLAAHGAEL